VSDTKDELTLLDLRSKRDGWGVFGPDLLGGLSSDQFDALCSVGVVYGFTHHFVDVLKNKKKAGLFKMCRNHSEQRAA
jgi:hypothetical protein